MDNVVEFPSKPGVPDLEELDNIMRQLIVEAAKRGHRLISLEVSWEGNSFYLHYDSEIG